MGLIDGVQGVRRRHTDGKEPDGNLSDLDGGR